MQPRIERIPTEVNEKESCNEYWKIEMYPIEAEFGTIKGKIDLRTLENQKGNPQFFFFLFSPLFFILLRLQQLEVLKRLLRVETSLYSN